MLRKNSILLLFVSMFILIPILSSAEGFTIIDGDLNIPAGGSIKFSDDTYATTAAGIAGTPGPMGPMGPMGPAGPAGPAGPNSITANAVIKICSNSTTCYCDAGMVIKALLAVTCLPNHFLERSSLIGASATGWTAGCNELVEQFTDLNNWFSNPGDPPSPPRLVLQDVYFTGSNPDNIVIACTTP